MEVAAHDMPTAVTISVRGKPAMFWFRLRTILCLAERLQSHEGERLKLWQHRHDKTDTLVKKLLTTRMKPIVTSHHGQ